jgi:hypothetical protein
METTNKQQETPMVAQPQEEHEWLQKLVGEWMYEGECATEPGKPADKMTWTETVRSLGGLWVLGEAQGNMPGGGAGTTIITLGYDPQKKRFVGTFIGSMMSNLWIYEGTLDATGKVLTLDTEGPDMSAEGKTTKYRDVIEIKSDDHRVLTSNMLGDDGEWHQFMRAEYRRQK